MCEYYLIGVYGLDRLVCMGIILLVCTALTDWCVKTSSRLVWHSVAGHTWYVRRTVPDTSDAHVERTSLHVSRVWHPHPSEAWQQPPCSMFRIVVLEVLETGAGRGSIFFTRKGK